MRGLVKKPSILQHFGCHAERAPLFSPTLPIKGRQLVVFRKIATFVRFKIFQCALIKSYILSHITLDSTIYSIFHSVYWIFSFINSTFRDLDEEHFPTGVNTILAIWSRGMQITTRARAIWLLIKVPRGKITAGTDGSRGYTPKQSLGLPH